MRSYHVVMHMATQAGWQQGDAWARESAYTTPGYNDSKGMTGLVAIQTGR